jgi:hypothetical protein
VDKDIEELKEKLKDYYGTAMTNGFPMAVFELSEVDELSDDEIMEKVGIEPPLSIEFAKELIKNGLSINLNNIKDVTSLSKEIITSLKAGDKYE